MLSFAVDAAEVRRAAACISPTSLPSSGQLAPSCILAWIGAAWIGRHLNIAVCALKTSSTLAVEVPVAVIMAHSTSATWVCVADRRQHRLGLGLGWHILRTIVPAPPKRASACILISPWAVVALAGVCTGLRLALVYILLTVVADPPLPAVFARVPILVVVAFTTMLARLGEALIQVFGTDVASPARLAFALVLVQTLRIGMKTTASVAAGVVRLHASVFSFFAAFAFETRRALARVRQVLVDALTAVDARGGPPHHRLALVGRHLTDAAREAVFAMADKTLAQG